MKSELSQYSEISETESFHHFKILQDRLNKLEERVHKVYKNQKTMQKNIDLQNDQYRIDQSQTNRSIIETTTKIKKIQQSLNLKMIDNKIDSDKNLEMKKQIRNNLKIFETTFQKKLQDLKNQLRRELKHTESKQKNSMRKDEPNHEKLQKQMSLLKDSNKKLSKQMNLLKQQQEQMKSALQKYLNQSFAQQKGDQLQKKFTIKIEEGINSIQKILKNYINDQANIAMQLKNLELKINVKQPQKDKSKQKQIEYTKRDDYQRESFGRQLQEISSKTVHNNFFKNESKNVIEPIKKINRESSTKQLTNNNIKQEDKSYSSKKISDLKEKLKQFELINDKYQKQKEIYIEDNHTNLKNSIYSMPINQQVNNKQDIEMRQTQNNKVSNENKNAIDQLKQFKYLLENTESEIDISNTFNNELKSFKQNNIPDQKYKKLERVYQNINKEYRN